MRAASSSLVKGNSGSNGNGPIFLEKNLIRFIMSKYNFTYLVPM